MIVAPFTEWWQCGGPVRRFPHQAALQISGNAPGLAAVIWCDLMLPADDIREVTTSLRERPGTSRTMARAVVGRNRPRKVLQAA
jgi:CheY-like chemotaxis protein